MQSPTSKIKEYKIEEHLHRFAVWTAARAVARNFTGSENVKAALDNVKEEFTPFLQGKDKYKSQAAFDKWHQIVAEDLVTFLGEVVSPTNKVSYGRAAKIIAIYLKTVYVLRFPKSKTSKFIHPPIDRVLLSNIKKSGDLEFNNLPKWTKLDRVEYLKLIGRLRRLVGEEPFWKLEVFWDL